MYFNLKEIITVTAIMFAVIDIIGAIPVLVSLKQRLGEIQSEKAALVSLVIMIAFLFIGESLLNFLGIEVKDFAIAGSFIIFLIAVEMILGIKLYKDDVPATASIVPIAFPLIAGSGTLTTILSIREKYHLESMIIGIVLNVILVYLVLKNTKHLERLLGVGGIAIVRKVFGIILLAIAIKLFRTYAGTLFHSA
jgi:multiple antibiotic resistance protein